MKTQYIKNKTQFNLRVNKEEYELIKTLREKHAINISGAFKIFLKEMLEKLLLNNSAVKHEQYNIN